MTRLPWLWPAVISFSAVVVAAVVFGGVTSPLRPLVASWFLLVCPGMAFIPLLQLKESFAEWTLAIALSLALDAIVAGTMLYAGIWSPNFGLTVLISISMIGVVLQALLAYGRMIAPAEPPGVLRPGHLGVVAAGGLVVLALLVWAHIAQTDNEARANQPERTLLAQSTTTLAWTSVRPTATTATPTLAPVPMFATIPERATPTTARLLPATAPPVASSTPSLSPPASQASPTTLTETPTPTPCIVSPPPNWEQYTVRSGDNLYTLAAVRGSIAIVEVLGRVNCLENLRLLSVNQVLWLPPLPPTATPASTPTPP